MKQQRAKKTIILARVSTEEQARDNHHSIPAQLKNLREYCERKELEVIAEYEFDESASKDRRKKFETAIKGFETSKEPLAITVDKVDRFQRVAFDSLGQKQRVFEPYCLSLSSMVAAAILQNFSSVDEGMKIECWLWGENKQKGKRRIRSCPASLAGSLSLVERAGKKCKKQLLFDRSVDG